MSTPSPVRSLTDSRTAELDRQHGSWWYMLSARRPIDGLWIGQSKQGKDQIGSYLRFLVPLARLERATCCLGDNCQSSVLYGSVGSSQVRLGDDSGESGLVGFSCGLWNDRENDQLSRQFSICRLGCRVARRSGGRRLGGHPGSRRQGRQPLGGEPRPLDVAASREPVPGMLPGRSLGPNPRHSGAEAPGLPEQASKGGEVAVGGRRRAVLGQPGP
jgi:hypothetical protein